MTRRLPDPPYSVRFWHRAKGQWGIRAFRGNPSRAFREAMTYYLSRCQVDDIKPTLLNDHGLAWTGHRDAHGIPVWRMDTEEA